MASSGGCQRFVDQTRRAGLTGLVFYREEWILLIGSLLLGICCSLIPATQAYKSDISKFWHRTSHQITMKMNRLLAVLLMLTLVTTCLAQTKTDSWACLPKPSFEPKVLRKAQSICFIQIFLPTSRHWRVKRLR
jgi:hypothetical protein